MRTKDSILLFTLVVFCACRKDVNLPVPIAGDTLSDIPLHMKYYVDYRPSEDSTVVSAYFYKSSQNNIKLNAEQSIKYNGELLSMGYYGYHKKFPGLVESSFVFTDEHGMIYEHQVTIDAVAFTTVPDSVALNTEWVVSANGPALSNPAESVSLLIWGPGGALKVGYSINFLPYDFVIPASTLDVAFTYNVSLCRSSIYESENCPDPDYKVKVESYYAVSEITCAY